MMVLGGGRFLMSEVPLYMSMNASGVPVACSRAVFRECRLQQHGGVSCGRAVFRECNNDLRSLQPLAGTSVREMHIPESQELVRQRQVKGELVCRRKEGKYRGTSLIRNTPPPRATLGP